MSILFALAGGKLQLKYSRKDWLYLKMTFTQHSEPQSLDKTEMAALKPYISSLGNLMSLF